MSILFNWKDASPDSCPRCQSRNAVDSDTGLRCSDCKFWFRRLKSRRGNQESFQIGLWTTKLAHRAAGNENQDLMYDGQLEPSRPSKNLKRKREDAEKPSDFARITIIVDPPVIFVDAFGRRHEIQWRDLTLWETSTGL
jgi:hypothetical protein